MTIENLNSRAGQSARMQSYMFQSYNPKPICGVMDSVYCKSYAPTENINRETALLHGEISKAIERPVPQYDNRSTTASSSTVVRETLTPFEAKEHKSVKSEQSILNRIDDNIIPGHVNNVVPRNELFGIDTRSVIKY